MENFYKRTNDACEQNFGFIKQGCMVLFSFVNCISQNIVDYL